MKEKDIEDKLFCIDEIFKKVVDIHEEIDEYLEKIDFEKAISKHEFIDILTTERYKITKDLKVYKLIDFYLKSKGQDENEQDEYEGEYEEILTLKGNLLLKLIIKNLETQIN